jgi:hypothetical protein
MNDEVKNNSLDISFLVATKLAIEKMSCNCN